eukprot:m.951226 g.951226  ORF g.951226 m.951226 type:complete len:550 (-) comp23865_c0_seq3:1942-3591(-)
MDSSKRSRKSAKSGTARRSRRAMPVVEETILNHFQPLGSIKTTETQTSVISVVPVRACGAEANSRKESQRRAYGVKIEEKTCEESQKKAKRTRYASLAHGHCTATKRHRGDDFTSASHSIALTTAEHQSLNISSVQHSSSPSVDPVVSAKILPTPPVSPANSDSTAGSSRRSVHASWTTRERPCRQRIPATVQKIPELHEIWLGLEDRDTAYFANPSYIQRHPSLKCRMRSLLADWMIEVSEEFALHRETYYASMNFVDRYLSRTSDVPKSDIQLIGVSCLFTAAKIHEIYPPRLSKFADLTDGACTENEILLKEMDVLKTLQWNLSPVTTISWLEMYLQTASSMKVKTYSFSDFALYPHYFKTLFYGACQLLDFSTLDYNSVKYSPGVLAATALYLFAGSDIDVSGVTGFSLEEIYPCFQWMEVYAIVLDRHNMYSVVDRAFKRHVAPDDVHNIQAHCNPYRLLDQVSALRVVRANAVRKSPSNVVSDGAPADEHTPLSTDTSMDPAIHTPPRSQGECGPPPQSRQDAKSHGNAVVAAPYTPPKVSCS